MSVLGCGSYDAFILTRGGGSVFARPDWSTLSWSRVLDETSEASIHVDAACIGSLAGVLPWRHELAILRDGKQVWVGPVFKPSSPADQNHSAYELQARGITAWWDHRLIHNDLDFSTPTDLAAIFQAISDDALAVDLSQGLSLATSLCGVAGVYTALATQHFIAGAQLRDLANIGIDWTEIGRTVLAGGKVVPAASIGVLRDEHFLSSPVPDIDGSNQTNSWVIAGQGGGASGDSIFASAADAAAGLEDGVLESVDAVSTIQDYDSALAAANSRLALTGSVTSIQNAILSADAPVDVDELIPGAICTLDLVDTSIPIKGDFRLKQVSGQIGPDGVDQISLTLQPVGAVA